MGVLTELREYSMFTKKRDDKNWSNLFIYGKLLDKLKTSTNTWTSFYLVKIGLSKPKEWENQKASSVFKHFVKHCHPNVK